MEAPADIAVVLVKPKFQGNIGAVARAMANFGLERLIMVRPPELEDDAYRYSKHARPILENALVCVGLGEALEGADLSVATSGICNTNEKKRERNPVTPRELAQKLEDYQGTVALVLGPEDDGLSKEEIMACDLVVTIPTALDYRVMNLSHAASTLFYELWVSRRGLPSRTRKASQGEKEHLYRKFDELLAATGYPEHKREKTAVLFKRVMGRAVPTKWEFHTLMGVFERAASRYTGGEGGEGEEGDDDKEEEEEEGSASETEDTMDDVDGKEFGTRSDAGGGAD